jgi:FkbM family methyltransferase
MLKKNPKIPYQYFSQDDYREINYFLKMMIKGAIKKYLQPEDFEGRWEIFEKVRKEVGKKLKFNLITNIYELDGFKSVVYPDTGVYPDCYFFHKLKKRYKTVFDLGAYIGDTVYFADKFLKPEVIYAFEPDILNWKILKENIRLNNLENKVKIISFATFSKNGYLYFNQSEAGSNLTDSNNKNLIKVKTVTLDSFVNQEKIKKVDLIKMDIEGAEFDTLKGAVKTLKRDKPDLLVAIYHKGEHFFEIPGWLKKQVPEYNLRFLAFNEASPIIERFVAASVRRI